MSKKGEELDYAKMNGMTHEKLFSFSTKQKVSNEIKMVGSLITLKMII